MAGGSILGGLPLFFIAQIEKCYQLKADFLVRDGSLYSAVSHIKFAGI